MDNCSNFLHIKTRLDKHRNMSFKLNEAGLFNGKLISQIKSILYKAFCRPVMNYGLENTFISKSNLEKLKKQETRMVKRAIGVSKYTGSKKLFDALGIIEIENNIKIKKLNFFIQLSNYELTRTFLQRQLEHIDNISEFSLLREILRWFKISAQLSLEALIKKAQNTLNDLEAVQLREEASETSISIRYLLANRNKANNRLLEMIIRSRGGKK